MSFPIKSANRSSFTYSGVKLGSSSFVISNGTLDLLEGFLSFDLVTAEVKSLF
jgi:hypothetical protein